MKTVAIRRREYSLFSNIPYPNAATRKQLFNRVVDLLLTAALGSGAAAIILFLFALC